VTWKHTMGLAMCVGVWAAVGPLPVSAVSSAAVPAMAQTDLDAFMRQVLAKRDENWKKLEQYVLDEHEKVDVIGPGLVPMMGQRRDYRWYIRDGYFVRSPLVFDGIAVSEADRKRFEDDFLKQAKASEQRAAARGKRAASGNAGGADAAAASADPANMSEMSGQTGAPNGIDALVAQTQQPQFVDTAYFLRFKFEEGKYALVGREKFDGRDVLRIEYYPAKLFSDAKDRGGRRGTSNASTRDNRQDQEVERLMNKTSLVTLWIEPKDKQIVKFVFDNIQTDFMPVAWFIRLEDIKASMSMSQPFKDVWLPRDVDVMMKVALAIGPIDLRYHLDYVDYRQATTSGRIIGRGGR
jgi:hypothetical protein